MTLQKLSGHYINGVWIKGNGPLFSSINPANNDVIWQGTEATTDEVAMAYKGAQAAFTTWCLSDYASRVRIIQSFAAIVQSKKEALTHLISLETGKPLWESATEVNAVISKIDLSIKAYQERCISNEFAGTEANAVLRYKPHGVTAVLGPFNFPAHLSNGHIVPALLAGNTVIYKPSELTPAVADFIMTCWHETGIPSGVIQCIHGGSSTAKALLACDIQGVFFTGSYDTGVSINQQFASRPEVILALEMGGNNPLIIDEVADIKAAVYHTLLSSFISAGQRCSCARRLFIPNTSGGDAFLTHFLLAAQHIRVGQFTTQPEPFMGPVIRYEHAERHLKHQAMLINAGGKSLLTMSLLKANTGFLSPGVIDMSGAAHPIDDEIFAPLVQVHRYDDFDNAIMMANQSAYGLVAGLFSDNPRRYERFYQLIRAGLINWNRPTTGASSALPFGGIGKSGNHRPSAYFAADYCAYPIASLENATLSMPEKILPGIVGIND